jgi:dTDP-4-amino-4,6-dideoxygalactose transaminase
VCVTNDPEYQVMLRSLMNHGRDAIYIRIDDDQGLKGEELFEMASKRFSFTRLGHSFRATEMEAALGLAQISERENTYIGRVNNARRLTEGLAGLEEYIQLPEPRPHAEHGYMFYPIVVNGNRVSRDRLIQYLETNAIETRYLLPLINQPVYRQMFGDLDSQYPIAARLNRDAFYIGCHAGMTNEDVDYVVAHFHEFFSRTSA